MGFFPRIYVRILDDREQALLRAALSVNQPSIASNKSSVSSSAAQPIPIPQQTAQQQTRDSISYPQPPLPATLPQHGDSIASPGASTASTSSLPSSIQSMTLENEGDYI